MEFASMVIFPKLASMPTLSVACARQPLAGCLQPDQLTQAQEIEGQLDLMEDAFRECPLMMRVESEELVLSCRIYLAALKQDLETKVRADDAELADDDVHKIVNNVFRSLSDAVLQLEHDQHGPYMIATTVRKFWEHLAPTCEIRSMLNFDVGQIYFAMKQRKIDQERREQAGSTALVRRPAKSLLERAKEDPLAFAELGGDLFTNSVRFLMLSPFVVGLGGFALLAGFNVLSAFWAEDVSGPIQTFLESGEPPRLSS